MEQSRVPNSNKNVEDDVLQDIWMIRPCETYKDEHHECTCPKGRFNQYYIFGEFLSCDKWWQDYKSCLSWRKTNSPEDARKIIENEKERRTQRLKGALENDVWKYRSKPPPDWSAPLPEWIDRDRKDNLTESKHADNNTNKGSTSNS